MRGINSAGYARGAPREKGA